ncbi:MAG: ABC transporter ATP-binding protein [Acidobacteriota bacterium]|nr:ABC transporter ATP-binding protein [Acidobacteriota bacterium]
MRVQVIDLKRFFTNGVRAVDGLNFSFHEGQVFGFVGPNGAGKTTTMRIMATLDEPTSGDVRIDGVSVVEQPEEARRRVGYVPDTLPAHRDITIHEYLDFFARANEIRGTQRRTVVQSVEDFTGVTPLRGKELVHLSKGMKQRVSLARALLHDPDLLIMDEPAAGLDPNARIELRELIRSLAEAGKSIFISSHILDELSELCDGVVIIEQGRLQRAGHLKEILVREDALRTMRIKPLGDPDQLYRALLEVPYASEHQLLEGEVFCAVPADDKTCSDLLSHLIGQGIAIVEYGQEQADLEDLFMKVTRGKVQ